jgi:hypothetical protein
MKLSASMTDFLRGYRVPSKVRDFSGTSEECVAWLKQLFELSSESADLNGVLSELGFVERHKFFDGKLLSRVFVSDFVKLLLLEETETERYHIVMPISRMPQWRRHLHTWVRRKL